VELATRFGRIRQECLRSDFGYEMCRKMPPEENELNRKYGASVVIIGADLETVSAAKKLHNEIKQSHTLRIA
jgi:hypothetical protein